MDATKILIIEDDITLNKQIAALLKDRGFDVHQCHDGNQGLVTALRERFDLIEVRPRFVINRPKNSLTI